VRALIRLSQLDLWKQPPVVLLSREYHGATCRQRARRARLAVAPDRVAVLAGLDQVGHALVAARLAVTLGQNPHALLEQLKVAVTALLSSGGEPTNTHPDQGAVTESVTLAIESPDAVAGPVASSAEPTMSPQTELFRAVTTADKIDPESVRVVRGPDFEFSGSYQVLASMGNDVVLIGILRRSGRSAWQALTPLFIAVSGGPWRTRQDALVQLLLNHDLARRATRR
jgi:hypothetical protein